jgi:hypothetical protein
MDDHKPSDFLLIAEDIYLSLKEGGKAVATTPHEAAWLRLAISLSFFSVFNAMLNVLKNYEDFNKEYQEKLEKNEINLFRFVIEKALEKFKLDEIITLYELWIKAFFILPPNYEVNFDDVEKAVKIAGNALRVLGLI